MLKRITTCIVLCASFGVSNAANVAFFNDPTYVDVPEEATNLRATLVAGGHTVTNFTGTTAAAFTTGLSGNTILVIPELQNGDLGAALPPAARTVISNFVSVGGGTVQVHGGTGGLKDVNFMNAVFGYTLVPGGFAFSSLTRTAAAASTPFASGPASLVNNSAVTLVTSASLPAGAVNVYTPDAGVNSGMFTVNFGAGRVVFMGWDWFNAPPQGVADGGWLSLAALVSTASAIPPVGTLTAIPTLSEWSVILLALILLGWGLVASRRAR